MSRARPGRLKLNDEEERPLGKSWLNDRTITAFQNLPRNPFSHMEDLQDVFRQRARNGFHCVSFAFLQVLHVGECYWVTVSNVDS